MTEYVVVGLGNPGAEYARHRHNVGGRCVNRLAKRHAIELRASRAASTGKGRVAEAEVMLVRSRGFYNGTGQVIAPILKRERVAIENLIVVYDDLDLPEGRIRLRPSGSAAGNNGLKSIIAATGSKEFGRVRIGIGRPLAQGVPTWDPDVVMRYVLAEPPRAGREAMAAAVERACDAVEAVIRDGWERAMNAYNTAE